MKNIKIKAIDLFAGIGGIKISFENAGFKVIFSNDIDSSCKITYDNNSEKIKMQLGDISQFSTKDLPDFDVLCAGFPCQPFSIAGYRKGFLDTGRGDLFFEIVRILREKRPKAFLLENVKNLKTHDKGKTFRIISESIADLGYFVKAEVLNSMYYGNVPQNRERIYIVGFNDKSNSDNFRFPEPLPLTQSVNELLDERVDEKYYYFGQSIYPHLIETITEKGKVYQWRRYYVRANKKGVCPTLTANMGTGGHNVPLILDDKGIRKLTPRECARLQGFPEDFVLPNELPDSKLYKQIGNSVTIPVVERIAKNMKTIMGG